jgi:hypothetical protein
MLKSKKRKFREGTGSLIGIEEDRREQCPVCGGSLTVVKDQP